MIIIEFFCNLGIDKIISTRVNYHNTKVGDFVMSGGIFDYLMTSGFDMERIGSARDYFAKKKYQMTQAYMEDEEYAPVQKGEKCKADKKQILPKNPEITDYDAETEQERKTLRDMDRKMIRQSVYGGYMPSHMERDM